jgi:hypothetical protein
MISEALRTSLLSGGTAGGIVAAIWGLVSKLLLQRREEKSKEKLAAFEAESKERLSKVESDLRIWQNVVQARIDRSVFVTRAQFETEFEAMKEVFILLSQVHFAIHGLWPTSTFDSKNEPEESKMARLSGRLQDMILAHDAVRTAIEAKRPFFPDELYVTVTECLNAARMEAYGIRRAWGSDTLYNTFFLELSPDRTKFSNGYSRAANIIRDRIATLAILPRT